MSPVSSTAQDEIMDDVLDVEHILLDPISPDSSFASETTSTDQDAEEVESMLKLPDVSEKFDVLGTIFDCNDPELENLHIESHAFQCHPLARPEGDAGFVHYGARLLPFPIIAPSPKSKEIIVRHPFDFGDMFFPYVANVGFQITDEGQTFEPLSNPQEAVMKRNLKCPRPRRQLALEAKIRAGLKHTALIVRSPLAFEQLPTTRGDWKGQEFRYRLESKGLREAWLNGTVPRRLRDNNFIEVPYEGQPTTFVDKNLIMYAFRTERLRWLSELMPASSKHRTCQDRLNWECEEYQRLCGDNSPNDIRHNFRGDYWASRPGVDRQSKQEPTWTKFHRDHKSATDWLLQPENMTVRLIKMAASILRIRFPIIAQRVDRCTAKLIDMGIEPAIAKPLFGLWYNYCINAARPHDGIEGVSCQPHTDAQNLAIMMCALFVYGEFDWGEKAWLVLWEARLIIQLPIGVLFFYPSALFIHFNINIRDLHNYMYTTSNGEEPTVENCKALKGVKGRGSIVFFNQASVFQFAELEGTVQEATEQGLPTAARNETYIASLAGAL